MNRSTAIWLVMLILSGSFAYAQRQNAAPDFIVVQHAGSIGFISAGVGYDVFKGKSRASFHLGSVSRDQGGPLTIIAGKLLFTPWVIGVSDRVVLRPFDPGIMLSYHMGENFRSNVPDYVIAGDNYYWWNTALRIHLAGETAVSLDFNHTNTFKRITGYTEFNTNDLYLVSFAQNASSLKLNQLIKMGVGIRLHF